MHKAIAATLVCLAVLLALQYETGKQDVGAQAEAEKATTAGTEYIAREGDSWWKLAYVTFRERRLSSQDIENANPGKKLIPGTVILIPPAKGSDASPTPGTKSDAASTGVRLVRADAGDTAFRLALTYYKDRRRFRDIITANPSLNWADRLEGGEYVLLPEVTAPEDGTQTEESTTEVVEEGDFEVEVTTRIRQRRK